MENDRIFLKILRRDLDKPSARCKINKSSFRELARKRRKLMKDFHLESKANQFSVKTFFRLPNRRRRSWKESLSSWQSSRRGGLSPGYNALGRQDGRELKLNCFHKVPRVFHLGKWKREGRGAETRRRHFTFFFKQVSSAANLILLLN